MPHRPTHHKTRGALTNPAGRFAAAGADIAEVPSVEHDRLHGTSNLSAIPDGWRVLTTIGRERARSRRRTPAPAPRHLRAAS